MMHGFLEKVRQSWRKFRLKDRDFQRQVDVYQLHLLLSYKENSVLQKSEVLPKDSEIDPFLANSRNLTHEQREKDCGSMIHRQVKEYFVGSALKVSSLNMDFGEKLESMFLMRQQTTFSKLIFLYTARAD
jgi:hypothetical protein